MSTQPLATLLLKRQHQVFLTPTPARKPASQTEVEKQELRLLELGFVITQPLAAALRTLAARDLQDVGDWLVKTLAADLGADRPHVPLFRRFPRWVPSDTWALYVRRVCTWLLQHPEQPCVLCGQLGTVHALDPCAHLVCHACWDGSNYSGCPICHRRISLADPFLKPLPPEKIDKGKFTGPLKPLHLGHDLDAAANAHLQRLLTRATPLSANDRDDHAALLAALGTRATLPPEIPVKETMATTIGTLLRAAPKPELLLRDHASHLRTATDVLRVLCVWMGGAADLLTRPKPLRSPSRSLRRAFIKILEQLPAHLVIEDLQRHPGMWKRVGARLHPFEDHAAHPNVAAAFAVLRATDIDPASALAATLAKTTARVPSLRLDGRRLRYTSWAARLELALHASDLPKVLGQLEQRPGELLRRLDHVLRKLRDADSADLSDRLLTALAAAAPKVSPAVALTVLCHLRARTRKLPRRVCFPKGDVLRPYALTDRRGLLPADLIAPAVTTLEHELLRRAAAQPTFARSIIDLGLEDLVVPFNERTASRSLVALPRGSTAPVPPGELVRLFVHWMEASERVDLDLSAAFFDEKWQFVGQCDFTELTFEDNCVVHSGDLTSAPPPLGASEFIDLNVDLLRIAGARHVVAIIFSYNDVTFDRLPDAFAGFMLRSSADGDHFDARTVAQRFDLQGECKLAVPLTLDLETRKMRWLDAKFTSHGIQHQVAGYRAALAALGRDFDAYFGAGTRPSMWELACIHAAARTREVVVRQPDGKAQLLRRGDDEPTHAFYRRLRATTSSATAVDLPASQDPLLFAALRDDLPLPPGSLGYALRWLASTPAVPSPTASAAAPTASEPRPPEGVHRLAASDLLAALAR